MPSHVLIFKGGVRHASKFGVSCPGETAESSYWNGFCSDVVRSWFSGIALDPHSGRPSERHACLSHVPRIWWSPSQRSGAERHLSWTARLHARFSHLLLQGRNDNRPESAAEFSASPSAQQQPISSVERRLRRAILRVLRFRK